MGCGSGNNLSYFAQQGLECYGVDISTSAIAIAKKRLASHKLDAELESIENNSYPFDENFFYIVIVWHVLVYNDEHSIVKVLDEIRRVLKPGGMLLANVPTFRDFSVSHGKRLSKATFELEDERGNQKGAIVTGAETENDIRQLFREFHNLEIGYSEISIKNTTYSNWVIYGN